MRLDVCEFVNQTKAIDEDGFETVTESFIEIDCEIKSVTRAEHYDAKANKISVKMICCVDSDDFDEYGQPNFIVYRGKRYRVEREFRNQKTYESELSLVEVE